MIPYKQIYIITVWVSCQKLWIQKLLQKLLQKSDILEPTQYDEIYDLILYSPFTGNDIFVVAELLSIPCQIRLRYIQIL